MKKSCYNHSCRYYAKSVKAVINIVKVKAYLSLIRPKNWMKNVFVFIPLVFSLELFNLKQLTSTIAAFGAFCLISSAVYVFNDICDAQKDAAHPVKRSRPVASGMISKQKAAVMAAFLLVSGLAASIYVNPIVGSLVVVYAALNLSYSLWLKNKPIFDCFCIAAGFVLRVYTGGAASGEPVSDWLFLTIVAMSLFMAFGKRNGELSKTVGARTREVLRKYNANYLQGMVFTSAGLAIVFYSLWAMNRGDNMIYTVPLIIFIVSRYLLLISNSSSHGDPTAVIFGDKALLAAVGLYGLLTVVLLYFGEVIIWVY